MFVSSKYLIAGAEGDAYLAYLWEPRALWESVDKPAALSRAQLNDADTVAFLPPIQSRSRLDIESFPKFLWNDRLAFAGYRAGHGYEFLSGVEFFNLYLFGAKLDVDERGQKRVISFQSPRAE